MKSQVRPSRPNLLVAVIFSVLTSSIAVLIGIAIYSFELRNRPSLPGRQEAGQVASTANTTFMEGGQLQRNIDENATSDESLVVDTGTETPQFIEHEFTIHTGKLVSVELRNHSKVGHQHDWVLIRPGSRRKIEFEAREAGPLSEWIPDSSDVLAFVYLTNPGQTSVAPFRAPNEPGDYPFLCTFPGHGEAMHGIVHVKAEEAK